jgi:hypothetical protein
MLAPLLDILSSIEGRSLEQGGLGDGSINVALEMME